MQNFICVCPIFFCGPIGSPCCYPPSVVSFTSGKGVELPNIDLREFVWNSSTAVILASGASVPGVVHHAPCLGSGGSGGSGSSPAVPKNRVLNSKDRYLRVRVIGKVKKPTGFCMFVGRLFHFCNKNRYLRFRRMRNNRKT